MDKNLELYLEEQRSALIDLNKGIADLSTKLDAQIESYVPPTDEVKVSGSVEVNTQREVEVENLESIKEWLVELGHTVSEAVKSNSYKPVDEVTVKNIDSAITEAVEITNLDSIKTYFDSVAEAVKNNQPIVNVTKQEIKFPSSARDAIPVRLSDGKSFYNAITQAFSGGVSTAGLATSAKQDEIVTAIENIGGSSNYTTRIAENSGDANITYIGNALIGSSEASAVWQIKRLDATTGLTKLWRDGDDLFNNAWSTREAGSYS